MNQAEWLASEDPGAMLDFLWDKFRSERKERLFACASVRRVWHLFIDDRSGEAIEAGERFADGIGHDADRAFLCGEAQQVIVEHERHYPDEDGDYSAWKASFEATLAAADCADLMEYDAEANVMHKDPTGTAFRSAIDAASYAARSAYYSALKPGFARTMKAAEEATAAFGAAAERESTAQAAIIRDLYGNPFNPPRLAVSWRTPTVTSLALAAYANCDIVTGQLDFVRLAVLADALEEVGCNDAQLLGHLRSPGPHFRGCWPLDLVLAWK